MSWYETKRSRLRAEVLAIKMMYPMAKVMTRKGKVVVHMSVYGRKDSYLMEVIYPDDFPYDEPQAYIIRPRIFDAPHMWKDGHLSIHGAVEPPNISGKIIIDWTINWIKAYEDWLDTGRWPARVKGE